MTLCIALRVLPMSQTEVWKCRSGQQSLLLRAGEQLRAYPGRMPCRSRWRTARYLTGA